MSFPCPNEWNIFCSHLRDGKRRAESQESFHFIWQQGWWAAGFSYKVIWCGLETEPHTFVMGVSHWVLLHQRGQYSFLSSILRLMTGAVALGEQLRWEPQFLRQKHQLTLGAGRHLDPSLEGKVSPLRHTLWSVFPLDYLRHIHPKTEAIQHLWSLCRSGCKTVAFWIVKFYQFFSTSTSTLALFSHLQTGWNCTSFMPFKVLTK